MQNTSKIYYFCGCLCKPLFSLLKLSIVVFGSLKVFVIVSTKLRLAFAYPCCCQLFPALRRVLLTNEFVYIVIRTF